MTLKGNHAAIVEERTLFPTRVMDVDHRVLKSGINQRKLGGRVVKGKWTGMPIYSLTLEERATCPKSCEHWFNCYGNHMYAAKRYRHGEELERELEIELAALAADHPQGFVVRLHILGDFYSVHYVCCWGRWLDRFPNLRVFGYTARDPNEPIGLALQNVRDVYPDRWWVRWSGRDNDTWLSTGETGITCPVQTGKTDCCGTCALCWTAEMPIRFLVH